MSGEEIQNSNPKFNNRTIINPTEFLSPFFCRLLTIVTAVFGRSNQENIAQRCKEIWLMGKPTHRAADDCQRIPKVQHSSQYAGYRASSQCDTFRGNMNAAGLSAAV